MEFTDEMEKTGTNSEAEFQEPELDEAYAPPKKAWAERILVVIALLSLAILVMTVALCLPYIRAEREKASQPPTAPETVPLLEILQEETEAGDCTTENKIQEWYCCKRFV